MFPSLVEIPAAKDHSKMLVFVRGFQGWNNFRLRLQCCGSSEQTTRDELEWYCGLRSWGYEGRFLTFQWDSPASDCISEALRFGHEPPRSVIRRIDEAAEELCDRLSRVPEFDSMRTSLLGFSDGGWVIERALRIAWGTRVQIRRVYLFGASASCAAPWSKLVDCVPGGLWNFYSTREYLLDAFRFKCVGVEGVPGCYKKARNIDCSFLIQHHHDWSHNIEACLRLARLSPKRL